MQQYPPSNEHLLEEIRLNQLPTAFIPLHPKPSDVRDAYIKTLQQWIAADPTSKNAARWNAEIKKYEQSKN